MNAKKVNWKYIGAALLNLLLLLPKLVSLPLVVPLFIIGYPIIMIVWAVLSVIFLGRVEETPGIGALALGWLWPPISA